MNLTVFKCRLLNSTLRILLWGFLSKALTSAGLAGQGSPGEAAWPQGPCLLGSRKKASDGELGELASPPSWVLETSMSAVKTPVSYKKHATSPRLF